jgi:hypothetical protein
MIGGPKYRTYALLRLDGFSSMRSRVKAGPVPAIHVFGLALQNAWMPATSAGMTIQPNSRVPTHAPQQNCI